MRLRKSLALDITPLIDVVFILLIFFLITSTFRKEESQLTITIPSAEHGTQIDVNKNIVLEVSGTEIAFNGRILSLEEVDRELSKSDSDTPVSFRIDRKVRYGRVVTLLDLIKKYRFEDIVLITRRE